MNKYSIGIDFGGTNIKFGLVNHQGQIISRSRLSTRAFGRNRKKLIVAFIETLYTLLRENGLNKKQILGVGIGLPGFIDPPKGMVHFLPNVPGWKNTAIVSLLRKELRLPVYIENDANLIALAEWKLGAGKQANDLICITLGTGVGCGLILNGRLYRGSNYVAGEIGHVPYLTKTLEGYVGNVVLQKKAARIFKNKSIRLENVFAMAQKGNKKARLFWVEIGEHLGVVLAGAVNLINPRLIIIGGGVSNNFKFFGPAIKKTIDEMAVTAASRPLKVVRAKLGDDAGILGAHFLVKDATLGK